VDTASGTEYPGSNPTRLYISFNHGNVDVLNLCVEKEKQRHLPKFIRKKISWIVMLESRVCT
jgi:hypothetical protein